MEYDKIWDSYNMKYASEDLVCAIEDIAYWVANNLDDPVPLVFRNLKIQERFDKLIHEYRQVQHEQFMKRVKEKYGQ